MTIKRWKKVVLVLLGLLLLSQTPFIYRRLQLRRLRLAIHEINSQRAATVADDAYADYRGVMHVHSLLGGHSTGNFTEIIQAANQNQLHFVVMTEHPSSYYDSSEMTLKGVHNGVLFINGNEAVTGSQDRLLVMPGGASAAVAGTKSTQDFIAEVRQAGNLAFVAYPHEFRSWEAKDYNGIEIYNLYTNSKRVRPLLMFFDGLWSYGSYADLMFARFYERPADSLKKWDELVATKNLRLVATAGNDSHANVGLSIGDATGKKLIQILLDPYERSFGVVRNHVLIEKGRPLDKETLLSALANGHSYISFDLFGDATGFRFTAENRVEKKLSGDEIGLEDGVRLIVVTPVKSRIVLMKDGQRVQEEKESLRKEFQVNQRGAYRVEVYLDQLGESLQDKPWIISNPIYVK
jgi:hypothetical protein